MLQSLLAPGLLVSLLGGAVAQVVPDSNEGQTNKLLAQGYLQVFQDPAFDDWDRYFADTVIFNGAPMRPHQLGKIITFFRLGFPNLKLNVISQIAEGDKVATWGYFEGTHLGEFNGIPPTGQRARWFGCAIDRVAGGRVVEAWHEMDIFGLIQQLNGTEGN
jgi:predicted ester cyclase